MDDFLQTARWNWHFPFSSRSVSDSPRKLPHQHWTTTAHNNITLIPKMYALAGLFDLYSHSAICWKLHQIWNMRNILYMNNHSCLLFIWLCIVISFFLLVNGLLAGFPTMPVTYRWPKNVRWSKADFSRSCLTYYKRASFKYSVYQPGLLFVDESIVF